MENHIFISFTKNEFKEIIRQALFEYERSKVIDTQIGKNFSIPKAAEILNRTPATIKKLIETGKLKATSDGRRITHEALQEYLRIKD